MKISKQLTAAIQDHAQREYPAEACGLLVKTSTGREYVPCGNAAGDKLRNFLIDKYDFADAEDRGELLAVIHSHPDRSPKPSMTDRVSCELHELPWGIVAWPGGEMEWFKPSGYQAPLLGREFAHGLLDCWSACRDWYAREAGLDLPNFERSELWWEDPAGASLYEESYAGAGFVRVNEPKRGDMLVFQVPTPGRPCHFPNHAAIYLGSDPELKSEQAPALGAAGPFIYHHMPGRAASRDIYGFSMASRLKLILRHKEYRP
ncbi:C40 family peptidase [Pseudomonas sp. B26(2017)]|uniref:C40 family peptidase n=1 Tax=Pseudomonas sp. B26(2017) TaxID=1981732 RepID=UPI000A1E85F3|nr:C40 family peptidase [Pseudomonas sp. B26(2017)]